MRRVGLAVMIAIVATTFSLVGASRHPASASSTVPTLKQCKTIVRKETFSRGHLTVATDNPVYAPWFVNNTPSNQEGYEGALSYVLASELGFSAKYVRWTTEPYADSYLPGPKSFDFDVNEIAYNSSWANNVETTSSYYQVSQSLVAMLSDPIIKKHSPTQLKSYVYGALASSPALAYVIAEIKPKTPPITFVSLQAGINALEAGTIDAFAVDTPTGHLMVANLILDDEGKSIAKQVGQFLPNGDEFYVMVLQKGNPLTTCLDVALSSSVKRGTLKTLSTKWLSEYHAVPIIKP
jgi:polar amino acid transport system substrate-binding protein